MKSISVAVLFLLLNFTPMQTHLEASASGTGTGCMKQQIESRASRGEPRENAKGAYTSHIKLSAFAWAAAVGGKFLTTLPE